MPRQLAGAGLILAVIVAAGVWYARPSHSSSKDSLQLRDEIGHSSAVVVTFVPDDTFGANAEGDSTLTMIRGEGWVWQRVAIPNGIGAAMVVSDSTRTLTAVAPGCYTAIPQAVAPHPPEVPGVNLVADLEGAPGLKRSGNTYSYSVSGDPSDGVIMVTEDLGGVAQRHSYTARVVASHATPNSGDLSGLYTVREATAAEHTAAQHLLHTARPSVSTPIKMEVRAVRAGSATPNTAVQDTEALSLRDCPQVLANDYASLGSAPRLPLASLGESKPGQLAGAPMHVGADSVTLSGVVPIADFDAPIDVLAQAFVSPTRTTLTVAPGTTFGVTASLQIGGELQAAVHVVACTAAAWFPCGG